MNHDIETRIAVCSWSLQPESVVDLIDKITNCGLKRVQLALGPLLEQPDQWVDCAAHLSDHNIEVVSGMMACVGEDYSTIERIKQTGGIMPDATWPSTLQNMQKAARLAAKMKLKLVTFHAGFIPHDSTSSEFLKGVARVSEVAAIFVAEGVQVALETGQEPADALLDFLDAVGRRSVGVNFDPANMLLYGSGDPILALTLLMPYLRQVHIKDALPSNLAGQWGREVPAGTGDVNWPEFFSVLKQGGYSGPFCIEREAGGSRIDDIRAAKTLMLKLG